MPGCVRTGNSEIVTNTEEHGHDRLFFWVYYVCVRFLIWWLETARFTEIFSSMESNVEVSSQAYLLEFFDEDYWN